MFLAAVVQLSCASDPEANWQVASHLIERAAGYGAQLIATPENTNFVGPPEEKVLRAEALVGLTCSRFSKLARALGVHLLLGSFNEKSADPRRCHNTSVLFGPDGRQLAAYRKMHLFDVDLSDRVAFTESDSIKPGKKVVVAQTPLAKIGLSVCYDLRFPALYGQLVEHGATVLTVPAAFTLTTGKDHWHPLVRARAIENQCYLLAPAQFGEHDDEGIRTSYGHSVIIDPWGHVIAMASDGPGIALAEIDVDRVEAVRKAMPVAKHRRL